MYNVSDEIYTGVIKYLETCPLGQVGNLYSALVKCERVDNENTVKKDK